MLRERFLDHHRFTDQELQGVYQAARLAGAEMLVTTEKDAVRFEPGLKIPMPTYYLRVEIEILSGVADFEEAVNRICFAKGHHKITRRPFRAGE